MSPNLADRGTANVGSAAGARVGGLVKLAVGLVDGGIFDSSCLLTREIRLTASVCHQGRGALNRSR